MRHSSLSGPGTALAPAAGHYTVLAPDALAPEGMALAQSRPEVQLRLFPPSLGTDAFRALLGDAHAAVLGLTPFGAEELEAAPALRVVARIGVGFDTIDVAALTRRGVPLMVAGTANAVSVAEQALGFMFAWSKRIRDLHERVTSGQWSSRHANFPVELATKTVLIVGFGRIGTRMARRCVALEMRTLVYDPYVRGDLIRAVDAEPVGDLDTALAQADFVSLHCPKTPETIGLFNAARIARMKKGAVLINTARGGIVEEVALADAIERGQLAGAGLDVFASEPPQPGNRLLGLPQVITAPHMAGVTWEAWNRMATTAIHNVFDVFDGRPCLEHAVNPEVFDGLHAEPVRFAARRSAGAGD